MLLLASTDKCHLLPQAPASFIIDFAAQQYGMLSTPNMKDVHDQNLSFFSPQPYFIAGFFFPQQLFQLAWLYRLWKLDAKKPVERAELDQMGKLAAPVWQSAAAATCAVVCDLRLIRR